MAGVTSGWHGHHRGSGVHPCLFNISINDPDTGLDTKFANGTKLGETANSLEGREGLQTHPSKSGGELLGGTDQGTLCGVEESDIRPCCGL